MFEGLVGAEGDGAKGERADKIDGHASTIQSSVYSVIMVSILENIPHAGSSCTAHLHPPSCDVQRVGAGLCEGPGAPSAQQRATSSQLEPRIVTDDVIDHLAARFHFLDAEY